MNFWESELQNQLQCKENYKPKTDRNKVANMHEKFGINSSSGGSKDRSLINKQGWYASYKVILCSLTYAFFLKNVRPLFLGGSFPYITHSIASQLSICTSQGNIKTLLEVVERAMSCEVTVYVSFPH